MARPVAVSNTPGTAERGLLARTLPRLADLRYVVLRGDLDSGVGEFDLLVHPGDLRPLRRILDAEGFVRLPSWGYRPHRFHAAFDPPRDGWVKLDVVTHLAFGPARSLHLGHAPTVLRRRVEREGTYVPEETDAFWVLLLHVLLDGTSTDHRESLRARVPPRPAAPPAFLGRVLTPSVADDLAACVTFGQWMRLRDAGDRLLADVDRQQRVRSRVRTARNRVARGLGRLFEPARRGTVVQVRGGSAEEISGIADLLQPALPVPVVVGEASRRLGGGPTAVSVSGASRRAGHVTIDLRDRGQRSLVESPLELREAVWNALPRPGRVRR